MSLNKSRKRRRVQDKAEQTPLATSVPTESNETNSGGIISTAVSMLGSYFSSMEDTVEDILQQADVVPDDDTTAIAALEEIDNLGGEEDDERVSVATAENIIDMSLMEKTKKSYSGKFQHFIEWVKKKRPDLYVEATSSVDISKVDRTALIGFFGHIMLKKLK